MTASLETLLLLAAIWRQRATGQGCFFDISMAEATIAALPEPILAWSLNQELLEPRGNRDPLFAPQGCYPASGDDRWLAVSVQDDAAWTRLCRLIGRPDLLADPGLTSAAGRRARHDELDAAIGAWTRHLAPSRPPPSSRPPGIAATPTLTPGRRADRRHLAARGFVSQVEQPRRRQPRHARLPLADRRPAPGRLPPPAGLGQDNDDIFSTCSRSTQSSTADWSTTRSSTEEDPTR